MADDRILPMLGKTLGKNFFQEKKQPIPIKVTRKEALPFAITRCLKSTFMLISPGTCISIKAGSTSMSERKLEENITSILKNAISHIPRKWGNISAISVKTGKSVALPIYNKTREELEYLAKMANVKTKDIESSEMKKRVREEEEVKEELEKKKQKKEMRAKSPLAKALKKQITMENLEKSSSKRTMDKESSKKKKKRSKSMDVSAEDENTGNFLASKKFKGSRKGYIFQKGASGIGYYVDNPPKPDLMAIEGLSRASKASASNGRRKSSSGRRKSGGRKGRR